MGQLVGASVLCACAWMIYYFVVRGNLCMQTLPKRSPYPTSFSGDLSVLAWFIHLKVIIIYLCELVTGRCGGGGGTGETDDILGFLSGG